MSPPTPSSPQSPTSTPHVAEQIYRAVSCPRGRYTFETLHRLPALQVAAILSFPNFFNNADKPRPAALLRLVFDHTPDTSMRRRFLVENGLCAICASSRRGEPTLIDSDPFDSDNESDTDPAPPCALPVLLASSELEAHTPEPFSGDDEPQEDQLQPQSQFGPYHSEVHQDNVISERQSTRLGKAFISVPIELQVPP
ncbi:hypothetical protein DFJ73DRAFT_336809 [Zopfochytrium polystomum]|nr:hypothetical protein DFJ73DRAFT_336809 [Zopfochytrium polystomum]